MSDIIAAIDEAASALLKRATENATVAGDIITLADRVKAFDSICKWAEQRRKLVPQEKASAAFDRIRDQFHDGTARGNRASPKGKGHSKANGSAITPAGASAEPVTGSGDDAAEQA